MGGQFDPPPPLDVRGLKLYLWSFHMANNLILAISFGFKLNSNLNNFSQAVATCHICFLLTVLFLLHLYVTLNQKVTMKIVNNNKTWTYQYQFK